jgi:hypothetical protein
MPAATPPSLSLPLSRPKRCVSCTNLNNPTPHARTRTTQDSHSSRRPQTMHSTMNLPPTPPPSFPLPPVPTTPTKVPMARRHTLSSRARSPVLRSSPPLAGPKVLRTSHVVSDIIIVSTADDDDSKSQKSSKSRRSRISVNSDPPISPPLTAPATAIPTQPPILYPVYPPRNSSLSRASIPSIGGMLNQLKCTSNEPPPLPVPQIPSIQTTPHPIPTLEIQAPASVRLSSNMARSASPSRSLPPPPSPSRASPLPSPKLPSRTSSPSQSPSRSQSRLSRSRSPSEDPTRFSHLSLMAPGVAPVLTAEYRQEKNSRSNDIGVPEKGGLRHSKTGSNGSTRKSFLFFLYATEVFADEE